MCDSKLCELALGESGVICRTDVPGDIRRRIMDLGFVRGARVSCVAKAPFGDFKAYLIKNTVIALRSDISCGIGIEKN